MAINNTSIAIFFLQNIITVYKNIEMITTYKRILKQLDIRNNTLTKIIIRIILLYTISFLNHLHNDVFFLDPHPSCFWMAIYCLFSVTFVKTNQTIYEHALPKYSEDSPHVITDHIDRQWSVFSL